MTERLLSQGILTPSMLQELKKEWNTKPKFIPKSKIIHDDSRYHSRHESPYANSEYGDREPVRRYKKSIDEYSNRDENYYNDNEFNNGEHSKRPITNYNDPRHSRNENKYNENDFNHDDHWKRTKINYDDPRHQSNNGNKYDDNEFKNGDPRNPPRWRKP